jgi:hypothetical protein
MTPSMVYQEDVERECLAYLTSRRRVPKYVLMDPKTYEQFCGSFTPIDNVKLAIWKATKNPKLTKVYLGTYELEILSVNSDRSLFEVVG